MIFEGWVEDKTEKSKSNFGIAASSKEDLYSKHHIVLNQAWIRD